jgi:acetoin utilization protein AcuB
MLVSERMSHPVISAAPDLPILEALNLIKRERIRRTPVVEKGQLVGIVSEKDLLHASPSAATTLSVWEMNYLLSKITVKEVMTKQVLTVTVDTPIEEAARLMADNKIGGLPVMRDGKVVGIITETDLFKIFLEMLGARQKGVRISVLVANQAGEIAKLSQAIFQRGGNIIAMGTFAGEDPSNSLVTLKVIGPGLDELRAALEPIVLRLTDIRVC